MQIKARIAKINKVPFGELELYWGGKRVLADPEFVEDFASTGLSNWFLLTTEVIEEGEI